MAAAPRLIRDIEILRAVAVLGVIGHHLQGNLFPAGAVSEIPALLSRGGWAGVDLFFAVSGYVIARSFLPVALGPAAETPYRRIACRFWIRRFFRLAPSAWLWLLVILVLSAFYNSSGVFGTVQTNAWWTLAGVLNFANVLFANTFGVSRPGASFAYWSLSLEEQFYLLFPLLVWLFRSRLSWLLLAVAALQLFGPRGPWGMMFRTDALALGILLAIAQGRGRLGPPGVLLAGWRGRLAGCTLVVALFVTGSFNQQQLPAQVGLIALLSAALVWLCSGGHETFAGNGLPTRVLMWTGQRSYAMYLIHIPVIFALRESIHRLGLDPAGVAWASGPLALALIALLAQANFRWVEAPLRQRGRAVAARIGAGRPAPHTGISDEVVKE